jgi:hypothetical protein
MFMKCDVLGNDKIGLDQSQRRLLIQDQAVVAIVAIVATNRQTAKD